MPAQDVYRDTWLRYLGYANEVGEAFRFLIPGKFVRGSYIVAFSYVLGDTTDKALKMNKVDSRPKKVAVAAADALIWQTFASVIIPGYTINRICAVAQHVLKNTRCSPTFRNWMTAAVGLAAIPVIIHPIDTAVTVLMDETFRKWTAQIK